MKDDYTNNSHYLTYTFLFKRLGECNFLILEMKGLNWHNIAWGKGGGISKVLQLYGGEPSVS